MRTEYGGYKTEYVRRTVPRNLATTRSQELEKFAMSLRKGQVHALAAALEMSGTSNVMYGCVCY